MLHLAVAALLLVVQGTQETSVAYVVVTDTRGRPVEGLETEDFQVRLDDAERVVVDVRPATDPPSIVVVVDGYTDVEAVQVRRALANVLGVIRTRAPGAHVGLMADEGCSSPRLQDVSAAELDHRAASFVRRGDSAPLLECLTSAADALASAPARRRLIMVLTSQRNSVISVVSHADVTAAAIQRSGASLWVLQTSLPHTAYPSVVATEQLLREVPRASGGIRERRITWLVDENAADLTKLMLSQYAVTFAGRGNAGRHSLKISVARDGLEVLAPRWPAGG